MTADNFDQMLTGLRSLKPYRVFTIELHGGQHSKWTIRGHSWSAMG